jgi:hypothetical protein
VRLSSLSLFSLFVSVFLCFLFVPATGIAQHTTSPPPPPPPPAPHVSTPAAHVAAPAPSVSHSAPASHVASAPAPASHVSSSSANTSKSGRTETSAQGSDAVVPDEKLSSQEKATSAPRLGEDPAANDEKAKNAKSDSPQETCEGDACKNKDTEHSDADLRRIICPDGSCKEKEKNPQPTPEPAPPESELHHLPCPAGQTPTAGGCAAAVPAQTAECPPGTVRSANGCERTPANCPPGKIWNGLTCVLMTKCPPGQISNGNFCHAECSTVNNRAQGMIPEIRSARRERDDACGQDPTGTACAQANGHYQVMLSEYQNLLGGAPTECRTTLPDPSSL